MSRPWSREIAESVPLKEPGLCPDDAGEDFGMGWFLLSAKKSGA